MFHYKLRPQDVCIKYLVKVFNCCLVMWCWLSLCSCTVNQYVNFAVQQAVFFYQGCDLVLNRNVCGDKMTPGIEAS